MTERSVLLDQLDDTVSRILACLRGISNADLPVYEGWCARDILGHLTFWHESFARNLDDLANGRRLSPLKGRLRDLNAYGVEVMRIIPLEQVIQKFELAQETIRKNILNPNLGLIPYRKGSRDYSPEEHLHIVCGHIQAHLRDIEKAKPR